MVEVQFQTLKRTNRPGSPEWRTLATIQVRDYDLDVVEGEEHWSDVREIELVDPDTGTQLTFYQDPEHWARNLPQAFRHDIVAVVDEHAQLSGSHRRHEHRSLPAMAVAYMARHAPWGH